MNEKTAELLHELYLELHAAEKKINKAKEQIVNIFIEVKE